MYGMWCGCRFGEIFIMGIKELGIISVTNSAGLIGEGVFVGCRPFN